MLVAEMKVMPGGLLAVDWVWARSVAAVTTAGGGEVEEEELLLLAAARRGPVVPREAAGWGPKSSVSMVARVRQARVRRRSASCRWLLVWGCGGEERGKV